MANARPSLSNEEIIDLMEACRIAIIEREQLISECDPDAPLVLLRAGIARWEALRVKLRRLLPTEA